MRRISVQPNTSEGIGETGNVSITKNSVGGRSISPVGTPSKPPTASSKKKVGEKRYAGRGGNHGQFYPYYPIDYWCIFFLGFCVSYLIFGYPNPYSSSDRFASQVSSDALGKETHRGDSDYRRLLQRERELLSTNALLKKTISDLQYRIDLECKHENTKPSSMKKQLLKLRTELEGMKEFVRHTTDTRAITNAMEKAVLNARSSALEADQIKKKLAISNSLLQKNGIVSASNATNSWVLEKGSKVTSNVGKQLDPKHKSKENMYAFKKNMILTSIAKQKDFDLSRWSIWDVPLTELYRYWNWPPGPIGSIIYDQWVLGVTEENTVESRQVVAFALKVLSNMAPFKGSEAREDFTIDAMEKKKNIEIVRFERRIERFYGIHFSIHIKIVSSGDVYAVHLRRPLQKLHVENVVSMSSERPKLVNVIVSVSNRGVALLKMIKSLIPLKDGIRLVVVDHTSTDSNIRVMLRNSGLTNYKFLWAPKNMKRFSRALMLDYGIRSLDNDEIFFTCDVDMHVPHNLHEIVSLTVEQGARVYAPEVFQLKKGFKLKASAKSGNFFGWVSWNKHN